jgi:hypothetical protein
MRIKLGVAASPEGFGRKAPVRYALTRFTTKETDTLK